MFCSQAATVEYLVCSSSWYFKCWMMEMKSSHYLQTAIPKCFCYRILLLQTSPNRPQYQIKICWHKKDIKHDRELSRVRDYLHTYLLTPWSRILLEKLTGFQVVKKFPAFYGTQRFITTVASARHLSQSISPGPRLNLW